MDTVFDQWTRTVVRPLSRGNNVEAGEFWRKQEPVIEDDTFVKGGFLPSQLEWWDLPNFVKVFVGGYGSGKSMVLGKRAISSALMNAPAPVAVVSPTYTMALDTIVSTISELLAGKRSLLGKTFRWSWNGQRHMFTIRYKGRIGRIRVYSGDNPTRLKGPNLAAAYIDEPFIQDKEVLTQMVARVRHPDAKLKEICLAGTPEELNWGYSLCEGDLNEQMDVGVVHVSTTENVIVGRDYVQRLRQSLDPKSQAAFIEGRFVNLAKGRIYYGFDPDIVVKDLDAPEASRLGVGNDFNVDPMTAAVFWREGNHMHFFDEYEQPNADTEYLFSSVKDDYWEHGLRLAYPDASGQSRSTSGGKSDFDIMRRLGFQIRARSRNPLVRDRHRAVNAKMSKGTCTISPRCSRLIEYLQTLTHENLNKTIGKNASHLTDAFSYPISYLFPADRTTLTSTRNIKGY